MGYVEKVMGDNEQLLYRTHLHGIVLLQRTLGALFAFAVFLALGLTVLLKASERTSQIIGLVALGSLVMPLYLTIEPWLRGLRGTDYVKVIWRPALAGIAILVSAILTMDPETSWIGWLAILLALIVLAELIRHFLDWLNERYIITNRRVMEVKGIINKHVRDSALEKVNDVDLKQSIVGRILGYGTVQIITGSDIGVNQFRRISNPVRFKRSMLNAKEQLSAAKQTDRPETGDSVSPPAPVVEPVVEDASAKNITDLIVELAELRHKGVISEEEFQAKKKELLERL
jgi:hypothetical protein